MRDYTGDTENPIPKEIVIHPGHVQVDGERFPLHVLARDIEAQWNEGYPYVRFSIYAEKITLAERDPHAAEVEQLTQAHKNLVAAPNVDVIE